MRAFDKSVKHSCVICMPSSVRLNPRKPNGNGASVSSQKPVTCAAISGRNSFYSDTLGVSMLVDAINHRLPGGATETTVFGPFYVTPPHYPIGANIKGYLNGCP